MRSTRWPSPRSRTHPKNDGGPVASLRLGPPAVIWRRLCLPVCAVSEQPDLATQTGQVQDKFTAQTGQVRDKFHTHNPNITELVRTIQDKELSVKEIMEGMNLKGRDNFLKLYLSPAISEGFIKMYYQDSPRHPRQKYLLTAKGVLLLNSLQ